MSLKILVFDIETTISAAHTFGPGKQVISVDQIPTTEIPDIICITYCWLGENKGHALYWDPRKEEDSSNMIKEFDKLVVTADVIAGQNSDSFDIKYVNTLRMLHELPPFPDWAVNSDDMLKQLRRNFRFPSNKLDYISRILGQGGKVKTSLHDWVNIKYFMKLCRMERVIDKESLYKLCPILFGDCYTNVLNKGIQSWNHMIEYGKKDAVDTAKCFERLLPYVEPRYHAGVILHGDRNSCPECGSKHFTKAATVATKTGVKQKWRCSNKECNRVWNDTRLKSSTDKLNLGKG